MTSVQWNMCSVLCKFCNMLSAVRSAQLFQPLGEKLSYYNGKWFQVTILDSKAPES